MSAKFFRSFLFLIFSALILIPSVIHAQNAEDTNPLAGHIEDPIFLKPPSTSGLSGKSWVYFYLDYDYDRCRMEYGDNNYYRACGRSLGTEGKKIQAGVTITPEIKGEWRWESDRSISFTPSEYWKAGTNYTFVIDLDAMGVMPSAVFNSVDRQAAITTRTENVKVNISNMQYMQDPDDPADKLVSARLTSNYPVDAKKLDEKIKLEMEEESGGALQASSDGLKFEIEHDSGDMGANMSVPLKTLPDKDRYLRIRVEKGLEALHGGAASAESFSERTRIPSLSSYLKLNDIEAAIMRGEDGTPGQILSFSTNVKAKPADIAKEVTVLLLPEQHPVVKRAKVKKGETEPFYVWKAGNEITPEILKQTEKLEIKPMANADEYVTQFGFSINVPPGRYIYVKIGDKAQAFGGYILGRAQDAIVRIPEWPHDVEIMQDGSIMTLSGAKKLSLHARGTDKLRVEIAHIRTEALQHFISQTSGDIRNPSFENWQFQKEDIAVIDSKDIPMNLESPQASQYAALDFAPYLKDKEKGLFLLDIRGYVKDQQAGAAQQRFVLVTDMGLLVKQGATASRDVYLASFSTGKPVGGAVIQVLARNGLPVFEGKTDKDGHIALPDFTGYTREKAPVAITALKGNDFTFIPFSRNDRNLNMSKFEIGGSVTPPDGMNALLFSDRGIYRPGETAHLGAIVRNADWTLLPPELPLQLIITDPRGRTAQDTIIKFSPDGLQEVTFPTEEASPTGIYRAYLYISNDGEPGNMLGSASFKVEDFQPDRLRIKTVFSSESRGWIKPEGLKAFVTLTNLYGTAASERRIAGKVTLNPAELTFKEFEDYHFFDSYGAKARTVEYDLPDAKTNEEGKATLLLDIESQEQATYSLNLQSQGFEAGSGRGVTTYATALVSPMDYVVGYRTDANLNYLKKGGTYALNLAALGPKLENVAAEGLKLELIRKTFVSTLIKRGDGSFAYESVPREAVIKTEDFKIDVAGTALPLPATETGTFVYRIKDGELTVADIDFAIAGEGQSAAGADKEAVLDVRINKENYGPGEDIELNITAPYAGAGLITLESDHVLAHKWFKTDKTETIQTISIPADFAGKGYVSVAFIRDINSREIYLSPLSYAVVPFIANTEARTAKIELGVPAQIKPGEKVDITYKGNAKGKAVIYAIDTGILQVAKYKTPDPVNFFLIDRALQVYTSQMLDLLMPEFDLVRALSAQGGDAEAEQAALGKHLNPFRRKTLAPAVYWSGIVDLDTTEKTVSFMPPGHFNGEMQIMAVAVTDEGVGASEKPVTVQGEVIVTPNVPLFLAPGDVTTISATIANNAVHEGEFEIKAAGSEGLKINPAAQTITIPANGEKTVSFTLEAGQVLGGAIVTFEATLGTIVQKTEATLSVRPPFAKETTMLSGYAEKGSGSVELTRSLYEEFAQKEAVLSSLPTPYIYSLLRYLDGFPYGCSEQLVSKAFPRLSLYNQPEFSTSSDEMKKQIWDTVSDLRQRQTDEGGFSYWGFSSNSDQFVTTYSLDFLVRAQEENLPVPGDAVENGLRYLRNSVNEEINSEDDARIKAYGIYVLTRSGIVTTNEILHLLQYYENEKIKWKTDLAAMYVASSYKLMQQSELAEETIKAFEDGVNAKDITYKGQDWDSPWYNPLIKYARYITLTAQHFPEHMKTLDKDLIFKIAAFINESRYSTISSSYAIQALQDYAAAQEISVESLSVTADGKPLSATDGKPLYALPFDTHKIDFTGADIPIFYSVTEQGYNRTQPGGPLAMNMEISHMYVNKDDQPVSGIIKIGNTVDVVIKVRSHDNRYIKNVAIVELLPGGFELDMEDAGNPGGMDFIDKREDRVLFFGTVSPDEKTLRFRLRAVSKGTFHVPPPFAEAMYDLTSKARGDGGGAVEIGDAE